MTLQELTARESIRDVTARWTDAVNRRDFATFGSLWTEQATWTISAPLPMQVSGRTAIVAKLRELLTLEQSFFQALHEGVIDLFGDRATARWGTTEFGKPSLPNQGYFNHAVYRDHLERIDEQWLFSGRDYFYVYVDARMLAGNWYRLPANLGG